MKKTNLLKRLICVAATFCFIFSLAQFAVSAEGKSIIDFSGKKINAGDTVTVEVRVKPDGNDKVIAIEGNLNYDASIMEYTGGTDCVKVSDGNIKFETDNSKVNISFKSKAGGSALFSVANCQYAKDMQGKVSVVGSSARVTVEGAAAENADLKSLSLSDGTLAPAFSPAVTSYTATVPHSVTKCSVYATAADSAAKVEVSGKAALNVGKNTRVVTVTAPSGAQKKYTIEITRSEQEEVESSQPVDAVQSEPTAETGTVTVDGAEYTVVSDLSGVAVLNGFNIGTADYNGAQVAVATDGTYTVYYLKSAESEQPAPFVKNGDSFEPLKYMTIGESVYIFTDKTSADKTPAGFYPTTAKLAGFSVKCYAFENDKMSDFYITECYSNGKYGFYRYDTIQNTLQREPDFKLSENSAKQKDGFITRFNSLPNGGKIIVVCMILTALAIVALIVVFIIKTARGKYTEYPEEDDGYDDVFTDITDTDGYVFDSVTEDGETEEIQQTENDEAENDEAEDGEEETSKTEQ